MKEWDQYSMVHEPVSSLELMERAAGKCAAWILSRNLRQRRFSICCGKGNNGGDGLVIARTLLQHEYDVTVYILESGKKGSPDFQANLQKLHEFYIDIHYIQDEIHFPELTADDVVVDALFGYGLNQPLQGLAAALVSHINQSGALVVAIDLPSGLFADRSSKGFSVVRADHTLTFQCYKTGLLMQENGMHAGRVHVLDIGLHPGFLEELSTDRFLLTDKIIRTIYRPRPEYAHKGHFGHALLIAGSYGKMGAAVLAARACIRAGAGLLTTCLPRCGYVVMQTAVPEAMVITDENEDLLTQLPADIEKYEAIGIGPGMGTADATQKLMSFIVRRYRKPLVIDADGLNCLAVQKELLQQLPPGTILTPHPKEFDRLFGEHENDFDRLETAKRRAAALQIHVVLKGHHTLVATAGGKLFFNSTGNAGMARGGSGDVLTGMITALVAQGYEPALAAMFGVYLHGLAGDFAADALGRDAMTPGDLVECISKAFLSLGR